MREKVWIRSRRSIEETLLRYAKRELENAKASSGWTSGLKKEVNQSRLSRLGRRCDDAMRHESLPLGRIGVTY